MSATPVLLQHFLMFVVVPVWLAAGLADYVCHCLARIGQTSGVAESALHVLQFSLVGIPMLAVLFLEINALVLLVMAFGFVLHQIVAMWDVRYANRTRRVTPAEQHIHGILEAAPAIATAAIVILHWPQFVALFGSGQTSFALELKRHALPGWYLWAVIVGVTLFGVLPYGEELLRTLRQAGSATARQQRQLG